MIISMEIAVSSISNKVLQLHLVQGRSISKQGGTIPANVGFNKDERSPSL
jgi:hypothetical protein